MTHEDEKGVNVLFVTAYLCFIVIFECLGQPRPRLRILGEDSFRMLGRGDSSSLELRGVG